MNEDSAAARYEADDFVSGIGLQHFANEQPGHTGGLYNDAALLSLLQAFFLIRSGRLHHFLIGQISLVILFVGR